MAYYSHHMQKRADEPVKYELAKPGDWTAKDLHGFVNPFGTESSLGNNLLYGGGGALLGYGIGSMLDRMGGKRRRGLGMMGALAGLGAGLGGRAFVNSRLGDEAAYFKDPEQYALAFDKLKSVDPEMYRGTMEHLLLASYDAGRAHNRSAYDAMFGSEARKNPFADNMPVTWNYEGLGNK